MLEYAFVKLTVSISNPIDKVERYHEQINFI